MRARDLFFAMWTSDLFMKRVQTETGLWCVLTNVRIDVYGDEFEGIVWKLWKAGRKKTIKANGEKILESQIETGTPYMLYKDAANRKSNQRI
jgi:ribonucleoside-diphosphate reductase alpha chain